MHVKSLKYLLNVLFLRQPQSFACPVHVYLHPTDLFGWSQVFRGKRFVEFLFQLLNLVGVLTEMTKSPFENFLKNTQWFVFVFYTHGST